MRFCSSRIQPTCLTPAQTFFLSVAALAHVIPFLLDRPSTRAISSRRMTTREMWRRMLWKPLGSWIWQANLTTAAVWFVTLPLVLWRFHLCSPVGFLLNVFLGPYVWLMLWMGYLWLTVLAIAPGLSPVFLLPFELLLQGLVLATQWTASWDSGHGYVAGPNGWWVLGFYACLLWGLSRGRSSVRTVVIAVLVWVNVGLFASLASARPSGLTCDILGVGHGLAVIVETPSGKLLAYDAGSLGNPEQAANAVCQAVWQRQRRRPRRPCRLPCRQRSLQCRTDADGPTLMWHIADPSTFLRSQTPTASTVITTWGEHAGDGQLIAAGDRIVLDPTVAYWKSYIRLLGFAVSGTTPTVSCCTITYAGRRILLTGDLEREGLASLLASPRRPVDLLSALITAVATPTRVNSVPGLIPHGSLPAQRIVTFLIK